MKEKMFGAYLSSELWNKFKAICDYRGVSYTAQLRVWITKSYNTLPEEAKQ